jgi:hypothetical protein
LAGAAIDIVSAIYVVVIHNEVNAVEVVIISSVSEVVTTVAAKQLAIAVEEVIATATYIRSTNSYVDKYLVVAT